MLLGRCPGYGAQNTLKGNTGDGARNTFKGNTQNTPKGNTSYTHYIGKELQCRLNAPQCHDMPRQCTAVPPHAFLTTMYCSATTCLPLILTTQPAGTPIGCRRGHPISVEYKACAIGCSHGFLSGSFVCDLFCCISSVFPEIVNDRQNGFLLIQASACGA